MANAEGLTPKQARFVDEYLKDLNATAAYRRAGYARMSPNAENVTAIQVLRHPKVAKAIANRQKEYQSNSGITVQRVLDEYAKIAFLDARKFFDAEGNLVPLQTIDDSTAGALAGIEVNEIRGEGGVVTGYAKKIKITDKKGALDSLAKHLGMFVERHEHTGSVIIAATRHDEEV